VADASIRRGCHGRIQRSSTGTIGGRRLLGPDAADVATQAFNELGRDVVVRASQSRLGPATGALTSAWFAGWLAAAYEQDPHLTAETGTRYPSNRLADAPAGQLLVLVHHRDLLVRSPGSAAGRCWQHAAARAAEGVPNG
jgi:hypothetical protein